MLLENPSSACRRSWPDRSSRRRSPRDSLRSFRRAYCPERDLWPRPNLTEVPSEKPLKYASGTLLSATVAGCVGKQWREDTTSATHCAEKDVGERRRVGCNSWEMIEGGD